MNRSAALLILAAITRSADADSCIDIADDDMRLACFDAATECAAIASDTERLACLDKAFAASTAPDAPATIPDDVPAALPDPAAMADADIESSATASAAAPAAESVKVEGEATEEFGRRWQDEERPELYIEATIVELKSTGNNIDYLLLDNGQVWRETTNSTMRFREGAKVTISEGALGSFNLRMEGRSRYVKVRRVR